MRMEGKPGELNSDVPNIFSVVWKGEQRENPAGTSKSYWSAWYWSVWTVRNRLQANEMTAQLFLLNAHLTENTTTPVAFCSLHRWEHATGDKKCGHAVPSVMTSVTSASMTGLVVSQWWPRKHLFGAWTSLSYQAELWLLWGAGMKSSVSVFAARM